MTNIVKVHILSVLTFDITQSLWLQAWPDVTHRTTEKKTRPMLLLRHGFNRLTTSRL